MRLTKTGFRLNRNGKPITGIESEAFVSDRDLGGSTKHDGTYYFFNRKQGEKYIYLP